MGVIMFWSKWFGNKEEKASKVNKILVSKGTGSAVWTKKDYKNFANETYLKNVIAFRCIDEIAKNVASVPWGLFEENSIGERGNRVHSHPVTNVMERPNPQESMPFLILKSIAFLLMAGNSYFERVTPSRGPNRYVPRELHVHRPDRMKIIVNERSGQIDKYEYEVNGQTVSWKIDPITLQGDILQLKAFHPTDDWYGAAITEPTAREIDTSNEQTEWNKKLLENEGRPGMVVTIVGNLSDQQFEQMEKALKDKYGGSSKAGTNLILEGERGTKAEPYGWSPTDMDFLEGGRELARRIALGYGVPPQLLGIPGDSTFSNYETARLAFYEDTIFYYLKYLKGEWNNWLFRKEDRLMLDFIIDDIPALAPRRERMWKRAQDADFLTINEKRALVRLDAVPNGDVIIVPGHMSTLEDIINPPEEVEEEVIEDEGMEDEDSIEEPFITKGGKLKCLN